MDSNIKTQIIQAVNATNITLSDLYEANKYIETLSKSGSDGPEQKESVKMVNQLFACAGFKIERINKELRDIPEELKNGMDTASVKTDTSTVLKLSLNKLDEAKASTDTLIEQIEKIRDHLNDKLKQLKSEQGI